MKLQSMSCSHRLLQNGGMQGLSQRSHIIIYGNKYVRSHRHICRLHLLPRRSKTFFQHFVHSEKPYPQLGLKKLILPNTSLDGATWSRHVNVLPDGISSLVKPRQVNLSYPYCWKLLRIHCLFLMLMEMTILMKALPGVSLPLALTQRRDSPG